MSFFHAGKIRVMLIGGEGREHAIVWSLSKSPKVDLIICAPGNGGTARGSTKIKNCDPDIKATDLTGLLGVAETHRVDLVVPCSDSSIISGAVDFFEIRGFRVFGPSKKVAKIEGSKRWAKAFMERHKIPTASYKSFSSPSEASLFLQSQPTSRHVVKASGLAAGKGVFLCNTKEEAEDAVNKFMVERVFGEAGEEIVIEEFLVGRELSVTIITDGKVWRLFPVGQDAQRIYDGNLGPNTGDHKFVGFICTGIMQAVDGPKLLEYNARFGDPEAQALFPLLDDASDLADIMIACTEAQLERVHMEFQPKAAISLVVASSGYPGAYRVGEFIDFGALPQDVFVFHAGTSWAGDRLVTQGGRVLAVVCIADSTEEAIKGAYSGAREIIFKGKYLRTDIGQILSSW
ncbi:phosphoribosylglycinamide synthetase [Fusarium oxysporum Fo47]|uniref:phosphoribosylglycinamide synthetase n=1 Tax=Fusarium oxysporum Fo47 TaxID=660027 RepID=UPI002869DC98|nr:phosphoribosylglycinamide synthetase [Fusarium oxysporum Fo47]QKD59599.2 phosphoribosylglycinamide synthetase [Fusarium oxysporum Fo47]